MHNAVKIVFILTVFALAVVSFGFVDPNMVLSTHPWFKAFDGPLFQLVYHHRAVMAGLFFLFLSILFFCYLHVLKHADTDYFLRKKGAWILIVIVVILVFSYPALSYDLFNYMTTAKVTFTHHENPYLVMPIEITNEPYLSFTRAANKVALYGPIWILITAIPHIVGLGRIWQTIIAFKVFNGLMYLLFAFIIYRVTKSWKNVLFFAANPLVLIEILVSGHNDIFMMMFAVLGLLYFVRKEIKHKIIAGFLLLVSFLVKGVTIVLVPILFIKNISRERVLLIAYGLLAVVFFVAAPIREELYPWYAVWLITIASFLDMKKYANLIWFTIVLSFALELRHLPYIWMGYYEGPGPLFRTLFTVVPVGIYLLYVAIRYFIKKTI